MNNQMFIPNKIKVGYQKRQDTYTGQLAYVIYYDNKGKLRKETSWEGWRDKKIDSQEFDNKPISGFVLNRGVGGTRGSYSYDVRNEYIRVYDPRDFEIEISVANLLYILQESSSIKGKGLEGEFVYAWNGTELILLPVDSIEYTKCIEHTNLQNKKMIAKNVKPGYSYRMKNGTQVMYLGRYPYTETGDYPYIFFKSSKKHIFVILDSNKSMDYIIDTGFTKLAEEISTEVLPIYPEWVDKFLNSQYNGEALKIIIEPNNNVDFHYRYGRYIAVTDMGYMVIEITNGNYWSIRDCDNYYIKKSKIFQIELKNGKVELPPTESYSTVDKGYLNSFKYIKLSVINTKGTKIEVL